ncbi:MAG: ABC transporter ATP-binding protein [Ilumatobacter sp.]|nr:ABC transporter ATP-binding protein [Ilumatobacter sp.]
MDAVTQPDRTSESITAEYPQQLTTNVWKLTWRAAHHRSKELWKGIFLFAPVYWIPAVTGYLIARGYGSVEQGSTSETIWWAAAVAVCETVRISCWHHGALAWEKIWLHIQTLLRANMLSAQMASGGPHAGQPVKSASSAITQFRDDTEDVANLVDGTVDITCGVVFTVIAGFVLGTTDAAAAAVLIVPLIAVALTTQMLDTRIKKFRAADREATEHVTGLLGDILAAATTVKVNDAQKPILARLRLLVDRRRHTAVRDRVLEESMTAFSQGAADISLGLILVVSAGAIASGTFNLATLTLFTIYLTQLNFLPRMIGSVIARRKQANVAFSRMGTLVANSDASNTTRPRTLPIEQNDNRTRPEPLRPNRVRLERLDVKNMSVSTEGRQILTDVSFTVHRGEFVVITGPVGAGKSTLLRTLLGLMQQTDVTGTIHWNNIKISDRAAFLIPPNSAYLPQVPQLISDSIADNVSLGPTSNKSLEQSLNLAAVNEDISIMKDGTATTVGPRGMRLSGGQRQRISLARALHHKPEIVILDDLSSAIDNETETQLWNNLVTANMTIIAVSHRPAAQKYASQILHLKNGRL